MASTSHRSLPFDRGAMLEQLRSSGAPGGTPFDVLVVGGGVTGVGVALDAAHRGLRTALIERDDFASGTSSKSSKLVHGGLRYLQNGDVRLVYEALHERRRLMRNAPHLVEVLPFLLPIMTKDGVISKKIAKALGSALWMYDLTGGWRIGKLHRRLSADEAAAHFPTTHLDKLSGAYLYYDASVDDARLTLTIARTAASRGAVIANRCALVDLRRTGVADENSADENSADEGGLHDLHHVHDLHQAVVEADGERFTVAARCVVNAAGVWADDVRALDEGTNPDSIRPAKGVHVNLPWSLVRNDIAVIVPVRRDKRSLFVVPWGPIGDGTFRHVYAGTTDTDFDGSMDDPQATAADIDYILEALNQSLDTTAFREITHDDITGVWAGLRPLVKRPESESNSTTDLSRRHAVAVSPSGVVTVTGGKLTTYREMAADTVDAVVRLLPRGTSRRRSTKRLRLFGAQHRSEPDAADHLYRRYGSSADEVRALIAFDSSLGEPLVEGLPYLRAEAAYAVRHEMATTLDDVLLRRTRAHLLDRAASLAAAPAVADLLAVELGWDRSTVDAQLEHYRARCAAEEAAGDHVAHPTH